MHHGTTASHRLINNGRISHIALYPLQSSVGQGLRRQIGDLSVGQVVKNTNGVVASEQGLRGMAANKSRSTGNQYGLLQLLSPEM
jgi:heme oxygenase